MNEYFTAISAHLDDKCDISVTPHGQLCRIVTIGVDCILYHREIETGLEKRYNLSPEMRLCNVAIATHGDKCFLAGANQIFLFDFATENIELFYTALGTINDIACSTQGRFLAIGSDEPKCIVIEIATKRVQKCRPGHQNSTLCSVCFSFDDKYVASIGKNRHILVSQIGDGQAQQVLSLKFTSMIDCSPLRSSFHRQKHLLYIPGGLCLQKAQLINNKWQTITSQVIKHGSNILVVQAVQDSLLATSCDKSVMVWNCRTEDKLAQVTDLYLTKMVAVQESFMGTRNDGTIYSYSRKLKDEEPMVIESDHASESQESNRIQFEDNPVKEQKEQEEYIEQEQQKYLSTKKSKADKIITCYPQNSLTRYTAYYNDSRFLYVNQYGCIIQRRQHDQLSYIQFEYVSSDKQKVIKRKMLKMKDALFFDMNNLMVAYANDVEFGLKCIEETSYNSWDKKWVDIQGIALGTNWLAVANDQTIKLFDIIGLQLKNISFDRQLITLSAYENFLVVVYHETVPMMGCQNISMQIFIVDSTSSRPITTTHVPITPNSTLRWFGFSQEGMLVSQDSLGSIRVFSLASNSWTAVTPVGIDQLKRLWLIAMNRYQLVFWKTSDVDPEPTVAPRFQLKTCPLTMANIGDGTTSSQLYSSLVWQRYCLDHQQARIQYWGLYKYSRKEQNPFYNQSQLILTEEQLISRHVQLDNQFSKLIKSYLSSNQHHKAVFVAKSTIRSIEVGKELIDIVDTFASRALAIELEYFFDQKERERDYKKIQALELTKLRQQAERMIKPKSNNPMRRTTSHNTVEPIPSLSQSQNFSQDSIELLSERSSGGSIEKKVELSEWNNPFVKKRSSQESMETKKKQIEDQMSRYGLLRKVDDKRGK